MYRVINNIAPTLITDDIVKNERNRNNCDTRIPNCYVDKPNFTLKCSRKAFSFCGPDI